MPFLVQRVWNGCVSYEIDYVGPSPRGLTSRLGRETARVKISAEAAALGIDQLLTLARLPLPEAGHGA